MNNNRSGVSPRWLTIAATPQLKDGGPVFEVSLLPPFETSVQVSKKGLRFHIVWRPTFDSEEFAAVDLIATSDENSISLWIFQR